MHIKPIDQQVCVVVGASSGIGRASALLLAKRGACVVVAARSEPGLQSLVDEITRQGGRAIHVVADVTKTEQMRAVASAAIQQYGRIDTWVHCAAVLMFATCEQSTEEECQRIMDVNYMGVCRGAWAALPYLRQNGGSLVIISSVVSKRTVPLIGAYNASKAAVEAFLETLRTELQHDGAPVNVVSVKPATINTPLFDKCRNKMGDGLVKWSGPSPIYQPEVVAECVLYGATHGARDLYAGTGAFQMKWATAFFPGLMDTYLSRQAYTEGPQQGVRKDERDNFYKPIDELSVLHGRGMEDKASSWSAYNSVHTTVNNLVAKLPAFPFGKRHATAHNDPKLGTVAMSGSLQDAPRGQQPHQLKMGSSLSSQALVQLDSIAPGARDAPATLAPPPSPFPADPVKPAEGLLIDIPAPKTERATVSPGKLEATPELQPRPSVMASQ